MVLSALKISSLVSILFYLARENMLSIHPVSDTMCKSIKKCGLIPDPVFSLPETPEWREQVVTTWRGNGNQGTAACASVGTVTSGTRLLGRGLCSEKHIDKLLWVWEVRPEGQGLIEDKGKTKCVY